MRVVVATTVALALLAGTGQAADYYGNDAYTQLTDKRPASMWSGAYFGVTLGYGWADLEATRAYATVTGVGSASLPLTGFGTSKDSVNGGVTLGYNWYGSNLVAGIEVDVSIGDQTYESGTLSARNVIFAGDRISGSFSAGFDWFGTARARIGFLVTPQTLLYGTGGFAWAYADASGNISYNNGAGAVSRVTFSDSQFEWGWTIGAGVEQKFAQNLSAKLEYLYIDYSNGDFEFSRPGVTVGFDTEASMSIIRAGLNYKFW